MTQMGMILGTAAYMAPEQASGRAVDKRADIWAFGVVLWEMLAGRQMFDGETISHVLAAVLTREPDLTVVPPRVRHLLTRCLEKDPRKRLRDIGDAMSLVAGVETSPASTGASASSPTAARRGVSLVGWGLAGVLAAALAFVAWLRPAAIVDVERPVVRFQIERTLDVYDRTTTAFAVSPDGQFLAYYAAGADGPQTLLVRTLATGVIREVKGSATPAPQRHGLFWSADSRQLVRGDASGAQIFDVVAGTARSLCDCRWVGGSSNRDGTILLGGVGARNGISRVAPGERTPVAITAADATRGEEDGWPTFLPDGRRFLFTRSTPGAGDVTYLASLDGGAPRRIVEGSHRAFVPAAGGRGAYLLGIDATGLVAQPFDPDTAAVTGAAVTVVPGAIAVSASANGVLATSGLGSRPRTVPTWFDRRGTSLGQVGESGLFDGVALSPDGRKLALAESDGAEGSNIWLRDLVSGARTRLTFDRASTPVWSPDGTTIAYTSQRDSVRLPYQRAADGTGGEVPLFPYDRNAFANDWSSDGRLVIYSSPSSANLGNDLWVVRMDSGADRKPVPYLVGAGLQQQAQFSPDGRFVAYGSDQSGTWEIYVQNRFQTRRKENGWSRMGAAWSRDGAATARSCSTFPARR